MTAAVADQVEVRADRDVVGGGQRLAGADPLHHRQGGVQRDRSFTTPTDALETSATTVATLPSVKEFEAFDYFGGYQRARARASRYRGAGMKVEEAGPTSPPAAHGSG